MLPSKESKSLVRTQLGRRDRKMEWKDGKIEEKGIEILNLGYTMRAQTNTGKERDLRGKTWAENCLTFQGSSCPQRRFRVSKTAKIVNTNCLMLPRCACPLTPFIKYQPCWLVLFWEKGCSITRVACNYNNLMKVLVNDLQGLLFLFLFFTENGQVGFCKAVENRTVIKEHVQIDHKNSTS